MPMFNLAERRQAMKKQELKKYSKIVIIASVIGLCVCVSLYFVFPIPRGSKVNSDYYTYSLVSR